MPTIVSVVLAAPIMRFKIPKGVDLNNKEQVKHCYYKDGQLHIEYTNGDEQSIDYSERDDWDDEYSSDIDEFNVDDDEYDECGK